MHFAWQGKNHLKYIIVTLSNLSLFKHLALKRLEFQGNWGSRVDVHTTDDHAPVLCSYWDTHQPLKVDLTQPWQLQEHSPAAQVFPQPFM